MIRRILILFWALCLVGSAYAAEKREWRCLWVDSWQPGFLSAEQCDNLLATARRYRFNTLFVEVRRCGDAYFNSSIDPRASNIQGDDFDPLQYLIQKAHEAPVIDIHAWIVVYRAWVSKKQQVPEDRRHVVHRHSEWLAVNRAGDREAPEGYYLDPALPEVQNYLVSVMRELIERYDIDGLHLDYVRYPGSDWGYGSRSLDLWRKATGQSGTPPPDDPSWCSWRREQITALVRRLYGELAVRRPGAVLSPAAITWGGLEMGYPESSTMNETFQDWFGWKREGIVDLLCPMNYKRAHHKGQAEDFSDWIKAAVDAPGKGSLVVGLAGWLNTTPNTILQIKEARQLGADGVAIFSYQQPTQSPQSQGEFLKRVSDQVFRGRVQPPEIPWKSREAVIHGQVQSGLRGVAGSRVRLHSTLSSGEIREATTDQNGYFLFTRLSPSRYSLDVLGTDDRLLGRATVTVQAGQGLRRDLRAPDSPK
ncbi:MAG: family 10 glycosylhydrolase [bacterium]